MEQKFITEFTIDCQVWDTIGKQMLNDVHDWVDTDMGKNGQTEWCFADILAKPRRYRIRYWTNVNDRNGSKIRNDDIVRARVHDNDYAFLLIQFYSGPLSFSDDHDHTITYTGWVGVETMEDGKQVIYPIGKSRGESEHGDGFEEKDLEIIGNIYQNPELKS